MHAAKPRYYQEVDYLRALAILLVVFRHSHYAFAATIYDYPMALQGTWSGVDLFFVISGFVITLSLLPLRDQWRSGAITVRHYLGAFFVKRIFRLLPVGLFALALNVGLAYAFNESLQFGPFGEVKQEILPILLYYYNYYVWTGGSTHMAWYWSLSIEEQFYFLYPFLLLLIPRKRWLFLVSLLVIAAVTFVVRPWLTPSFESVGYKLWPTFTTPSHLRFDGLFAGCAAALLYLKYGTSIKNWLANHRPRATVIVLTACFGVACFGAVLPHFEVTSYPAIILCSVVLVLIGAANLRLIAPLGLPRVVDWIGRRSYAIYLFHLIALHAVNEIWLRFFGLQEAKLSLIQGFVGLIAALALTVVLSELAFRIIETPGIRFGHKMASRLIRKQA